MKLSKQIKIKDTTSLFMSKYQYKVVLVCPMAGAFRGNDLEYVKLALTNWKNGTYKPGWLRIKDPSEMDYCFVLCDELSNLQDYTIRVEHPWINFYTNNAKDVEKLAGIDVQQVKYICMPSKNNPSLQPKTIIVKTLDFDYKVHMGKTRQDYSSFVNWATNNKKIRLTKRSTQDLSKSKSWGGSYFYVKDEKTLTMVKVFVGSDINKIESVLKA